jgi:hypothetical protein
MTSNAGRGQCVQAADPCNTVDWNAIAAEATANFEATGQWYF